MKGYLNRAKQMNSSLPFEQATPILLPLGSNAILVGKGLAWGSENDLSQRNLLVLNDKTALFSSPF